MRDLITYLIIVLSFILSLKAKSDNTYENLINKSEKNLDVEPFIFLIKKAEQEKDIDTKYRAYIYLLDFILKCGDKMSKLVSHLNVCPPEPYYLCGITPDGIIEDDLRNIYIKMREINFEQSTLQNYYSEIHGKRYSLRRDAKRLAETFIGKKREQALKELKKYDDKPYNEEEERKKSRKLRDRYDKFLAKEARRRVVEEKNKKPKHPKKPKKDKDNNGEDKGKKKGHDKNGKKGDKKSKK